MAQQPTCRLITPQASPQLPSQRAIRRRSLLTFMASLTKLSINRHILTASFETPLSTLELGYLLVIYHLEIINVMIATTNKINHVARNRIKSEVVEAINEGATFYVFVQPRMSPISNPISVHFTLQFIGGGTISGHRMIESYNFMKGDNTTTSQELKNHWKKHGIHSPSPRSPNSLFKYLFASVPANSKLAITDLTYLGHVDRNRELLSSTAFGIAANKPSSIIYECNSVLYLEVDAKMHQALEALHRLGEQAYSRGRGISFGFT
ncbi:hypothetical protein PanWU01x14_286590 [Parasponia andersonii]|uniref:Uncharacterized protein n=1 Tax=Parasponia andersonii TaxID=3476 RepID=A0A2P5AZ46_PARAD|nr:hypothetical protein PanWU01x14_286590 [Parasponia andersonii]